MSTLPLVSIIIPCYNAASRLETCLLSCDRQSHSNLEILVIDNNSTDNSLAIARRFAQQSARSVQVMQCSQQGACWARNAGFAEARGDYIQWLDADDTLDVEKITFQVAALEKQSKFDIACGDWEWCFYHQQQCDLRLFFPVQILQDTLLQFLINHWHPPHAYLLRRAAAKRLDDVRAFHPETQVAIDREYFTTAAVLGLRFLPVPGAKVAYNYWSSAQISRSTSYTIRIESMRQMYERFRQHALARPPHELSGMHWFLLHQRWESYQLTLMTLTPLGDRTFWLQHPEGKPGLALSVAEARIVQVLSLLGGTMTVEDHAFGVTRWLCKWVAQEEPIEMAEVEQRLSQAVGLLPETEEWKSRPLVLVSDEPHEMDAIPLCAPLFSEQRLATLKLLEKLRRIGLLVPVSL